MGLIENIKSKYATKFSGDNKIVAKFKGSSKIYGPYEIGYAYDKKWSGMPEFAMFDNHKKWLPFEKFLTIAENLTISATQLSEISAYTDIAEASQLSYLDAYKLINKHNNKLARAEAKKRSEAEFAENIKTLKDAGINTKGVDRFEAKAVVEDIEERKELEKVINEINTLMGKKLPPLDYGLDCAVDLRDLKDLLQDIKVIKATGVRYKFNKLKTYDDINELAETIDDAVSESKDLVENTMNDLSFDGDYHSYRFVGNFKEEEIHRFYSTVLQQYLRGETPEDDLKPILKRCFSEIKFIIDDTN